MNGLKVFILCMVFITGCNQNKHPKDIIEQEKMIDIMTDLHVIDGYMSQLMYSDTRKISGKNLYAAVYNNHHITKQIYEKSLKYYSMDPVLLDSMYSKVEKEIDLKEKKLVKKEERLNKILQEKQKKLQEKK